VIMEDNNTYSILSDPEMKEIVESFIVETKEIFEKLDVDLVELERNSSDVDLLNQIFRAFHTIKGTSGFLGLEKLQAVTHRAEDILNKLRKGEVKLNSHIMDSILMAFDTIKALLYVIEVNKNEDVPVDEVVAFLNATIEKIESKESSDDQPAAESQPEEANISAGNTAITDSSVTAETSGNGGSVPKPEGSKPAEHPIVQVPLEDKKSFNQTEQKAKDAISNLQTEKKGDNSIRVDVERLEDLLNIVSELVLGRNRLAQVNSEAALEIEGTKLSRDLGDVTKQIDLMTNELQLVVMKTRMVKISKVFNRYPRTVRDLSKETKKEVRLIMKGEETELDKTLIEEINDPLVHLIRNALDHGIELPEVRKSIGKDPVGTVTLTAQHEGNNIIITIEDDGKGMDENILREKAIAKGLITAERAKEMSKQEAFNLIFIPGFSTAEKVTNVSGRGVGMDVVKTNVTKLRGMINIESAVGVGSKIIIKLPLTLAIIPGLIIKVRSELAVIPLNSVIEVVKVHKDNIYTINKNEVIKMRDSVLPLVSIEEILTKHDKSIKERIWQYVVVIGIAEKKFGIKVDELIGQKEIVIKSLGKYLGTIEGLAGSTIMGDGTVVMILDISEIVNKMLK
jgi:two-component system, chemotaxis family, sensor kinase CheA